MNDPGHDPVKDLHLIRLRVNGLPARAGRGVTADAG